MSDLGDALGHSDQLLQECVLVLVGTLLLLKWLVLRRNSAIGTTLARNNLVMAVAYYAAAASVRIAFFRTPQWRVAISLLVALTAGQAFWEIVKFFGGWRATGRELRASLLELLWWWSAIPWWMWFGVRTGGRWVGGQAGRGLRWLRHGRHDEGVQ